MVDRGCDVLLNLGEPEGLTGQFLYTVCVGSARLLYLLAPVGGMTIRGQLHKASPSFQICLVGSRHYNTFGSHGSAAHVPLAYFVTLNECCAWLRQDKGEPCM